MQLILRIHLLHFDSLVCLLCNKSLLYLNITDLPYMFRVNGEKIKCVRMELNHLLGLSPPFREHEARILPLNYGRIWTFTKMVLHQSSIALSYFYDNTGIPYMIFPQQLPNQLKPVQGFWMSYYKRIRVCWAFKPPPC